MKNINKEGISEYVFTQLKKGNFKHWNEETLELDSLTLVDYINMKETTVKEYINSLINETTLKKSKKDINFEIFEKWNKRNTVGIYINQNPMKCSSRQRKGKIIYSKYSKENYKTEFD